MTKRREPTMRKRRSQLEETLNSKLNQKFKNLQQDWKTFKISQPRHHRRCSADLTTTLSLLDYSPRSLMSSLQGRVRSNDVARDEILRDRKTAIESGKLKGRRLFGPLEHHTEVGFGEGEEMCSVCFDLLGEGEVRPVCSYGFVDEDVNSGKKEEVVSGGGSGCACSGLSFCEERGEVLVVGGEKVGVNVDQVEGGGGSLGIGGGRWMLLMGWFGIALMAFTMGIIYLRCNGEYGDEGEVMLVPT